MRATLKNIPAQKKSLTLWASSMLGILALSQTTLFANTFTCTGGGQEKQIVVSAKGEGCQVEYTADKNTETKVLWTANKGFEYCNARADELAEKFTKNQQFDCVKIESGFETAPKKEAAVETTPSKAEVEEIVVPAEEVHAASEEKSAPKAEETL